ncbi:MAG: hypothetical protein V4649_19530 [Bacteroidota bacterium]
MNTSHLSKVDENLQSELAEYGLIRAVAAKKAPVNLEKPNFFGIEDRGSEVELLFSKDDKILAEATEEGMQLALVAPENEPFNMLLTRDFPAAIRGKDPETLREFLRRILDES